MMFVILDTNVIVSALLSPHGKPAYVFNRFVEGDFTLCADERILEEYYVVLSREKFHFDLTYIEQIMSFIRSKAIIVSPTPLAIPFSDESDKKFFEVAKVCNAVLITGNAKHFPADPLIKSMNEIF